ncbi:DNA topoisomerase III [Kushneria aurantia]|uniref:DNA topoisomerase n=1 Tax=Kushneria aurantia TaxID=504092 RepID=A0ABV6G7C6_9GAMM|nr:DNA topoisomerase III [Kushneria aurantia]
MQLIIAEKPSLGRAIAAALPDSFRREEGAMVGDTITVSWCFGHLLEQAAPEEYEARFKQWRLDHLPILPTRWQLTPRAQAKQQLALLKKLIRRAEAVIHAGDPDREGQLLVQETIEYLGWQGPVKRLLISDMNPPAVRRAWQSLQDNARFQRLYQAALARARADWLFGINLTRAWTLTGQQAGVDGVLSIGRVQTPLLGLIVRRDRLIENFEPVDFYPLWADFNLPGGALRGWWQPGEQHRLDDQRRLLDPAAAHALAEQLPGSRAEVSEVEEKAQRQGPPLPYSLSTLQIDAARRFKMPAQRVLDTAQRLYERHRLITYPRSDCRYLPRDYLKGVAETLTGACRGSERLSSWLSGADTSRRSRAFNDERVGAHHAIAPTGRTAGALSQDEQQVFELVTRNVLAQFYPPFEYRDSRVTLSACSERFIAKGRRIAAPGWRVLFNTPEENPLPAVTKGETGEVVDCAVENRQTRPPEAFNDASLINAMTHVARYVEDARVRATLRETDGLGTEATRAGMIETLLSRHYIVRRSGSIHATRRGRGLIDALPEGLSGPERTALWEQRLAAVRDSDASMEDFVRDMTTELKRLIPTADVERLKAAMRDAGGEQAPPSERDQKGRRGSAGRPRRRSGSTSGSRRKKSK